MTKKIVGVLMLVSILSVLSAYIYQFSESAYDNEQKILNLVDEYTAVEKTGGIEDGGAFYDYVDFDGVDSIFTIEGNRSVKITVYQNISQGRLKVVLIDPYGNIKLLNEATEFTGIYGYYKVKIIGDHATGLVSIDVEAEADSYYPSFNE